MSQNENTEAASAPAKAERKPLTVTDRIKSEAFTREVEKALPSGFKAEVFTRVALNALSKTPRLAECDYVSVMRCVLDCAALGITPDGRRAYLIPYKTTCTLVISYQGLVELVRRSGLVAKIHADVVCEGDTFIEELGEVKSHVIDRKGELEGKSRGKVYAVYALVILKDGTQQAAVMSVSEVNAIRDRSNSVKSAKQYGKETPWDTDWAEMAKKTAVRRLCKMLTLSPEVHDAVAREDSDFVEIDAAPRKQDKAARRDGAVVFDAEVAAETAEAGKEDVK